MAVATAMAAATAASTTVYQQQKKRKASVGEAEMYIAANGEITSACRGRNEN